MDGQTVKKGSDDWRTDKMTKGYKTAKDYHSLEKDTMLYFSGRTEDKNEHRISWQKMRGN